MKVHRLAHPLALQHNPNPMNPAAAQGRWNDEGWRVAYTSESVALAALEILGYWKHYPSLQGYRHIRANIPDDLIEDAGHLDPDGTGVRAFGNAWLMEGRSLALRVRSAVLPESYNILVNASHPDFGQVTYEDLGEFEFSASIQELLKVAKQRE